MKNALVIFLKAPVPGRCKTRLVPPLSHDQAAVLYKAFSADVIAAAVTLRSADIWIDYQSDPHFPTPAWTGYDFPFFEQKGALLGDRLIQAFDFLFSKNYARVAIIGTDAPSLPPHMLQNAFESLDRADAVFGPAEDGGYYLTGLSRPLPSLFQNVPWSTDKVMAETRKMIAAKNIRAEYLPSHYDVDTAAELHRLLNEINQNPAADFCPSTRACLVLLSKVFRVGLP